MYRLSPRSLCALCAVMGVAASLSCCPGFLSQLGLEPVQALLGLDLGGERQRWEELETLRQSSLKRMHTRFKLVRALAEGRLPLLRAAARLRALDLAGPVFRWEDFRAFYPGRTDEERFCHKAIESAVRELEAQPARARALRQRLEAELREALRRGPLRLEPLPYPAHEAK